ncbi:MAG: DUF2167 domain-containing protein [Acidobacteria bacterium]|nr:DUF2167 domain-containing protein [Acidobacteriota bacterium]
MSRLQTVRRLALLLGILMTVAPPLPAQEPPQIDWQDGPTEGELGEVAKIKIPEGYRFTGKAGTQKFMDLTQNPASGRELGIIVPATEGNEDFWFIIFEFDDIGYVKDDEKDELDADAILGSIREGTKAANEVRKERGWATMEVVGWQKSPFYDLRTNNLTWAIRGRSSDSQGESVNYSVRLLGRRGAMSADLVMSPQQAGAVVPQYETLVSGFSYNSGQTYADFKSGDKLAAYGLTALIAGGAGAVALKTGFLQKFWKLIVAAFVALAAAMRKIFQAIFRRGETTISHDQAPTPPTA